MFGRYADRNVPLQFRYRGDGGASGDTRFAISCRAGPSDRKFSLAFAETGKDLSQRSIRMFTLPRGRRPKPDIVSGHLLQSSYAFVAVRRERESG